MTFWTTTTLFWSQEWSLYTGFDCKHYTKIEEETMHPLPQYLRQFDIRREIWNRYLNCLSADCRLCIFGGLSVGGLSFGGLSFGGLSIDCYCVGGLSVGGLSDNHCYHISVDTIWPLYSDIYLHHIWVSNH